MGRSKRLHLGQERDELFPFDDVDQLGQSSARRVGFALAQPSVCHGVGKLVLVADVIRQAVGSDENVYPQVNGENSVPVSHHRRCDVAVETERDRVGVRLLLDEIASSIGCDVDFEPAICERVVAQHSPAVIRLDNECGSVGPQHALLPVHENPQVVRRVEVVIQQPVHARSWTASIRRRARGPLLQARVGQPETGVRRAVRRARPVGPTQHAHPVRQGGHRREPG